MTENNFNHYGKFAKAIEEKKNWPKAMCFGDSWFQYPIKPIDIQKQLPHIFRKTFFYNEGVAGRDSKQYKIGRDRVANALGAYGFNVLLLSMGGNDIVGGELREFVKRKEDPQNIGDRQWGIIPPLVRDHIRLSAYESALRFLKDDFVEMIQRRDHFNPNCEIFVHNYSYIYPNGKFKKVGPFKSGPWVYPYLSAVGVPKVADQRIITCWLIDQFTVLLEELASQFPRVRVIDARKALPDESSWENEIHPTGAGFKFVAERYWKPALSGILR
jgi:hypothetical protein